MLDATFLPFPAKVPVDAPSHVGRIKIGTETNGNVNNVVVTNCVLDGCFGLAVESEDGGHVEDISFSNITMRNLSGPPFFVRLGSRLRGPAGIATGSIRRVTFQNIDCWNADATYCSMLTGVPGADLEDISLENIRVEHRGGGSVRHDEVPEREKDYPDPQMFGPGAAHGFFVRHARGLRMNDVTVTAMQDDARPLLVMDDVQRSWIHGLEAGPKTGDEVCGRGLEQVQVLDASLKPYTIVPYQPK
jgi:polygalacturonase